jgi:glutathione synthase/RimK-type ligase-like ATP-grasp enzyme
VKLILARNQTDRFVNFYDDLQKKSKESFDYAAYNSLLFIFNTDSSEPLRVINLKNNRELADYDGVYINGYLGTYEAAAAVAICCAALGVGFLNKELQNPPSLSKLSSYAKLAAAGVAIPKTYAGSRVALHDALTTIPTDLFPAVLKRADADRGIDNFKVESQSDVAKLLSDQDNDSLWILQEYIANDGFYLVSFYDEKPAFSIYRSLEKRPDGNAQKAHMYKPQGGANASLIELHDVPENISSVAQKAITAMNRQIGSVDCLVSSDTGRAYVLEVNYNPQLVTIETFKDIRIQAFLDNLERDWQ